MRIDFRASPPAWRVLALFFIGSFCLAAGLARANDIREEAATEALAAAVQWGDLDQTRKMLTFGGDPNAGTGGRVKLRSFRSAMNTYIRRRPAFEGATLLSEAVVSNNLDVARALLRAGADPNRKSDSGDPPLVSAARLGSVEFIDLLVVHGGRLETRAMDGATPLLAALESGHGSAARRLLERGADIHKRKSDGTNALMLAATAGDLPLMERCLRAGMSINSKSRDGTTVIHHAVNGGNTASVEMALYNGALADPSTDMGSTPLHYASTNGDVRTAVILLKKGADPTKKDVAGRMPHHYAAGTRQDNPTKRIGLLKELQRAGADLTAHDLYGNDALIIAVRFGAREQVVRWLLDRGCTISGTTRQGSRALHRAAEGSESATIKTLASLGLDVNLQDGGGDTPIFYAIRSGREDNARALIEAGASVLVSNIRGETPLSHFRSEPRYAALLPFVERAAAKELVARNGGRHSARIARNSRGN